jgi:hypothetical protein
VLFRSALADRIGIPHRLFECDLRRHGVIRQANRKVSGESHAEGLVIEDRAIPGDHAGFLEFLNATQTGGWRKPDPIGELDITDAPI